MDNEAGFGADKVYYIPTDASGTVTLETVFGDNNPANPFLPRTITLHVDMNNQEVSSDGVHVAGSFQGWDPAATQLLDPDMDGIYAVDIEANAGDTFSAQVEPIQFPHVHQQFKKEPFITSVSGVTGNGSLLLAFNVPSRKVACISTITSFARGPTGRITGASGSRTISSPQK